MYGLGRRTDDIDVLLHAVAGKMGFAHKLPHMRHESHPQRASSAAARAEGCTRTRDRELLHGHGSEGGGGGGGAAREADLLRAAHHLIKQFRCGGLGKFVLDDTRAGG